MRFGKFVFLLILLLTTGFTHHLCAQNYSYVYIQGDKQKPFYVKIDGNMQPRYGVNYSVIPQLLQGTIHVDVLFQQNAYPQQSFNIFVPENGYRGFLLTQKDNSFFLYDLQYHFYLPAGNDHDIDQHVYDSLKAAVVSTSEVSNESSKEKRNLFSFLKKGDQKEVKKETGAGIVDTFRLPPMTADNVADGGASKKKKIFSFLDKKEKSQGVIDTSRHETPATVDNGPKFLNDIVLSNDHSPQSAASNTADCGVAIPVAQFDSISAAILLFDNDEAKVNYFNNQPLQCYSSDQSRSLAISFSSEAARYTFLKNIYPHITDKNTFSGLVDLFTDATWKTAFQQIINPG